MIICTDSESRSRITGVDAQMKRFKYLFGTLLGSLILKHSDNLSKTLQSPKMNASEGQHIAEMTCQTLEKLGMRGALIVFGQEYLNFKVNLM